MKTIFSLLTLCATTVPSAVAAQGYGTNYPDGATITSSGRVLNAIKLTSPSDGLQTVGASQSDAGNALFLDRTAYCFAAAVGETVTPTFDWTGTWMHGYVYIDCDNDGSFDATTGSDRDVMAYSNFDNYNSAGTLTSNGNVGVNPPAFTIPQVAPGLYRMRYKVDWNSIDPGGNRGDSAGKNTITANGGSIADVMIYIHEPGGSFSVSAEGGTLTTADGQPLSATSVTQGHDLKIIPVADEGYTFDAITISSGYDCGNPSLTFANPSLGHSEKVIPAYTLVNGAVTVPASMLCSNVKITASFLPSSSTEGGNYESDTEGTKDVAAGITSVSVNGNSLAVASASRHCFIGDKALPVLAGSSFTVTADYTGSAIPLKFYIDHGQDGTFSEIEGGISSDLLGTLTGESKFTINPLLPLGVYRARIVAPGDCTVDFLINLHAAAGSLDVKAMNGNVVQSNGSALPLTANFGSAIDFKCMTVYTGFTATEVIVRHGHNLNGPAYIKGNRQWQDTAIPIKSGNIPAELVDGDVDIYVIYKETDKSEWTKVWGDEFNGNAIDPDRWQYQARQGATWNRLVAQGDERPLVNVVEDGHYKSYCIPTPDEFAATEDQPMISGALNTRGLFHLTYGRIEARIKTTRHIGNFPAFWMMPMDQSKGWPKDGEIDIWEQIDEENRSYHTVHSGWTYKSYGDVAVPTHTSSGNIWVDHDLWHVYAIEWDSEAIRWYVDGQLAFTYANAHYSDGGSYTEEVTWPFYKDFYVIINQSVGNGSWAKNCDTSFTYLTEFDWVRAYKKKDDKGFTTSIEGNGDDPDFYVAAEEDPNIVSINEVTIEEADNTDSKVEYYDLRGIRVDNPSAAGLYIRRCGNDITKILRN